jgi:hypothetical protein
VNFCHIPKFKILGCDKESTKGHVASMPKTFPSDHTWSSLAHHCDSSQEEDNINFSDLIHKFGSHQSTHRRLGDE